MPPEVEEIELDDTKLLDDNNESEVPNDEELEESDEDKVIADDEDEDDEDEDKDKKKDEKDEDKPFPYERPSIGEIKAEFPDFFKKFPIFRDVVFRETEFTKIFPTIEDAKEANDDVLAYHGLRDSVLSGNSAALLDAVAEADKSAAEKFAISFLPSLHKKDVELYTTTVTPLFENLTRLMGRSSDENIRNAALVAAHFLWGADGVGIVSGNKTFSKSLEDSPEVKKLKEERAKHDNDVFLTFRSGVMDEMRAGSIKLISKGLDPDGTMSEYAKKTLIQDIMSQLDSALVADASHMRIMNARWMRSKKEGLNSESKEKLVSAYLSRAKQVIPSIRDKARNDFLGVRKKTSDGKLKTINNKSPKEKAITSGKVSGGKGPTVLKPDKKLYRTMSDMDILAS